MSSWFLKTWRAWRRAWSSRRWPQGLPAIRGEVVLAILEPSGGEAGPTLRTVFRRDCQYRGMADVEIRGFLDGDFKFQRNVATQYHVRVGCEGSKPARGRYEVMRVLQRWDVSALPRDARVHSARIVLAQEDCSAFPHRYPLRWPVDFYAYEVKKRWGPGRGGAAQDNQSPPEPGDAWWVEASAGAIPWKIPGCGYGSDEDPEADRSATPLAWCRLRSPADQLVFSGPRLEKSLEEAVRQGRSLDILIKASDFDEQQPGSVKTFFSAEFGEERNPELRPRLEVEWSAPCLVWLRKHFVLEPGKETSIPAREFGLLKADNVVVAASLRLDEEGTEAPLRPQVLVGGLHTEGARSEPTDERVLDLPVRGSLGSDFRVTISAAVNPVVAGDHISFRLLETWAPSASSPEALAVTFRFTAPSGRTCELRARHVGNHEYAVEFRPDELGVWTYAWRTRPDLRFKEQRGAGHFTVVRAAGASSLEALRAFAEAALGEVRSSASRILARRQTHFRLCALLRELVAMAAEAHSRGVPIETINEIRELQRRIREALPLVD